MRSRFQRKFLPGKNPSSKIYAAGEFTFGLASVDLKLDIIVSEFTIDAGALKNIVFDICIDGIAERLLSCSFFIGTRHELITQQPAEIGTIDEVHSRLQ